MKEKPKILFPVDLSEASGTLVPYVEATARSLGGEVHVLLAADSTDRPFVAGGPYTYAVNVEHRALEEGSRRLHSFVLKHFKDSVPFEAVVFGDPTARIVRYALENGIDLIVMGTRGRKGLDWLLYGSVTERVIENSPVPVLTVRIRAQLGEGRPARERAA